MTRENLPALRLLALLVILVVNTGCTRNTSCRSWLRNGLKVGPEYCRPSASTELQWIDMQADSRLVGDAVDLSRWWTALGDSTLDGLVETAYDENLMLR